MLLPRGLASQHSRMESPFKISNLSYDVSWQVDSGSCEVAWHAVDELDSDALQVVLRCCLLDLSDRSTRTPPLGTYASLDLLPRASTSLASLPFTLSIGTIIRLRTTHLFIQS